MPLHLYASIYASGKIPGDWEPILGELIKFQVRQEDVRRYLHELLSGRWHKVIRRGTTGKVHYFEHASGQVAGVKYFAYGAINE